MRKLLLDLDALNVESFETAAADSPRGTVKGAEIGLPTFIVSMCASACMPSGPRPCFNTETCC